MNPRTFISCRPVNAPRCQLDSAKPGTKPSARYGPRMAYDAAPGQIVIFGGYDGSNYLNETWTWNGITWTELSPATSPGARRELSGFTYDAAHGQLFAFGGETCCSAYGDTWVFQIPWNMGNVNVCPRDTPLLHRAAARSHSLTRLHRQPRSVPREWSRKGPAAWTSRWRPAALVAGRFLRAVRVQPTPSSPRLRLDCGWARCNCLTTAGPAGELAGLCQRPGNCSSVRPGHADHCSNQRAVWLIRPRAGWRGRRVHRGSGQPERLK